jgi:AraC-like DNA-binding protein
MPTVQDPLHRFLVFRTSNAEELQAVALARFGATRVALAGHSDFEAQASFVELQHIALAFGATSSGMRIEQPETDFARLQIALKGSAATTTGRHVTAIDHRQACMTSANNATVMDCDGGHERLTLRVNNAALERKLASLVGGKPKGNLEFEAALNMEQPRAQTLLRMLLFLGRELNSVGSELPAIVVREMEQSIMVAVLSANRHSLSGLLDRDSADAAAPWQVRVAEEYIVANCNRPIMIEELTAVTGVSARCLFKSFKRSRSYTPMVFAKLARLRRARQIFSEADEKTTVAGTAFNCGFSNLGHFAKDYRQAFGELPSETLSKQGAFITPHAKPMVGPMLSRFAAPAGDLPA